MRVIPQQSRIVMESIEERENEIIIADGVDEEGNKAVYKRMRVTAVGTPRILATGVEVPIPLIVDDEICVDFRHAYKLKPITWYGGKEQWVIDYAYVLCKIERDANEPVSTPVPEKIVRAPAPIIIEQ